MSMFCVTLDPRQELVDTRPDLHLTEVTYTYCDAELEDLVREYAPLTAVYTITIHQMQEVWESI